MDEQGMDKLLYVGLDVDDAGLLNGPQHLGFGLVENVH